MTRPAHTPEDGGPAFPFVEPAMTCNVNTGMTLRDYFAASALQGLCAGFATDFERWPNSAEPDGYEVAAIHAYALADAMLAARTTPTTSQG